MFAEDALSDDQFLGGRVTLLQPKSGYRAGIDPVLLASAVDARAGQSVLDVGCGAGAVMLCLGARVPGLDLVGLELQPAYADLARRNAARQPGISAQILEGDVASPPAVLRDRAFDLVVANPPYFEPDARSPALDDGRETARAGAKLSDWTDLAARRLKPKGYLYLVLHADQVPELFAVLDARLGSFDLWPVAARRGRDAGLVLFRARKGGRAPFRLRSPLVLHYGDRHLRDGESYTPQVSTILRNGDRLEWPKD